MPRSFLSLTYAQKDEKEFLAWAKERFCKSSIIEDSTCAAWRRAILSSRRQAVAAPCQEQRARFFHFLTVYSGIPFQSAISTRMSFNPALCRARERAKETYMDRFVTRPKQSE